MTVGSYQLVIFLAIEVEAGLASLSIVRADEVERADANAGDATIQAGFTVLDAGGYMI